MAWTVLFDEEFDAWLKKQEKELQDTISMHVRLIETTGPYLKRPHVDTIKGSLLPNLKELRVQYKGNPWRILFIFDPKRRAILLVGGNKRGDERWYKIYTPIAERRFKQHLEKMEKKQWL